MGVPTLESFLDPEACPVSPRRSRPPGVPSALFAAVIFIRDSSAASGHMNAAVRLCLEILSASSYSLTMFQAKSLLCRSQFFSGSNGDNLFLISRFYFESSQRGSSAPHRILLHPFLRSLPMSFSVPRPRFLFRSFCESPCAR